MFPNNVFNHPQGSFQQPIAPPVNDPTEGPQTSVTFACAWLPYVRGALTQLLLQSTWSTDVAGLALVQQRVWTLINLFADKDCAVCDCIEFVAGRPVRFVSDGHGGGSFIPDDPRTDGTVPPPWPMPPVGQTGNCLSAANVAGMFKDAMVDAGAKLTAVAAFGSILVGFESFLDLALPLIGEVIQIATEMAVAATDAGAVAFVETFDPSSMNAVYHEFQCCLSCNMNSDGSISPAGIERAKARFAAYLPGPLTAPQAALWLLMVNDFLDSQGPNGLALMGRMHNISSADCSDCGCDWCYKVNFPSGLDFWSIRTAGLSGPAGVLVAGGVHSAQFVDGSGGRWEAVHLVYTPGTPFDIHRVEINYDYVEGDTTPTDYFYEIDTQAGIIDHKTFADAHDGTNLTLVYDTLGAAVPVANILISVAASRDTVPLGGHVLIKSITMFGPGTNPFGTDNCS